MNEQIYNYSYPFQTLLSVFEEFFVAQRWPHLVLWAYHPVNPQQIDFVVFEEPFEVLPLLMHCVRVIWVCHAPIACVILVYSIHMSQLRFLLVICLTSHQYWELF